MSILTSNTVEEISEIATELMEPIINHEFGPAELLAEACIRDLMTYLHLAEGIERENLHALVDQVIDSLDGFDMLDTANDASLPI